MALAGLKKQFNKANQYMSEKIGGVEGTKYTDEFSTLERKTDCTNELVDELINKTKEYLQPNPASRTKLMVSSKLKGVPGKPHTYPQPEGTLGEIMCKYGKDLSDESHFAQSLIEMGEAMKELAEIKYSLEDNVKQNFLEPLTHLQAKDLKDVLFHRKKLEGRRLDYDCKKRKRQKGTHITEDEIRLAEDKFEESFNLASMGMHNLLQNEIEQLSQICVLAEALYEYHSQCANVLESLNARLVEIKQEAAQRTFQPYVPKKLQDLNLITPIIGHIDDLSPGDTQMNGSKFYSKTPSSHHGSTNSLASTSSFRSGSGTRPSTKPKPIYPNLKSSSSWSSKPSSAGQMTSTNGHLNGVTNSTTAYLLSGKPNSSKSQFQSSFSKSIPNVSNLGTTGGGGSNQTCNVDLLGSIETSTYDTNSHYQYNTPANRPVSHYGFQTSVSPSVEHPAKPTNLFLDTSKANATLRSPNASPLPSPVRSPARTPTDSRGPCCQALYDFDAENDNELSFKEGDIIQLVTAVDDNWYEGTINGRQGLFPVSYVQVLVPLQQNSR